MNYVQKTILALIIQSSFANASVDNYPVGFEDFFYDTEKQIHIVIAGENQGVQLSALVNYDTFKVEGGGDSLLKLKAFLNSKNISADEIEAILSAAVNGIESDPECTERLTDCLLTSTDEKTRYIFDFDNELLKLFISPKSVENKASGKEYRNSVSHNNAINNWMNLYVYSDLDSNDSVSFNNQTTIGLPLGHVYIDSELSSNNSEIYTGIYDVDFSNGFRVQVGKNRYNPEFNSTDFLSDGADFAGTSLLLGSSNNLLIGEPGSLQTIQFYAPQNGQLEIYRDDRLILNRVVNEGQQTVTYDELPKGAYEISIYLKVAGSIVLQERRQVVNNDKFSLAVNSFDFNVGVGQLEFDNHEYERVDKNDATGREYARAAGSYRVSESLLMGAALTSNDTDQYIQLGGSYLLTNNISFDYSAGVFTNHDYYHSGRLSLYSFYADFESFVDSEESSELSLSNYLYSQGNEGNFGIGWSGEFVGGTAYVYYSRFNNDYQEHGAGYHKNLSESVSASWSRSLFGGFVTVSTIYSESEFNDDFSANLSWTHEFGSGVSGQLMVTADDQGFSQNTNYLRYDRVDDGLYSNVSVGATIDRSNEVNAELSGTVSGSVDAANINAYAFARDGSNNVSASISGTQIFSTKGVYLSNEKSRSFSNVKVIKPEGSTERKKEGLYLSQTQEGDFRGRTKLNKAETLIKLNEYQQMGLVVEQDGENVELANNRKDMFSYPGSFYQMEVQAEYLLSEIVILDDMDGNAISQVQCIGDGCVGVEPVTEDGVFRINYRANSDYYLVSRKGICLYEVQDLKQGQDKVSRGYCLPGIDKKDNQGNTLGWEESAQLLNDNKSIYLYLGQFEDEAASEHVISNLESASIKYKQLNINGIVYIYIVEQQAFTQVQKDLLKKLDAYVMLQSDELDILSMYLNKGLQK
ncbi:hypothetical protein GCM10007916_28680 [Psychromonas marina]|uniref:Pilus assembly protein E-set like domain-containing protein n=1 Tax=Psychromonas marina TaxID=88364 RepID=A0ABQ6E3L7_9GAMM|nr:TcfC E-set like domain-containing protein [Psychromonas marina]GLS91798.1 hypothetical protein GCM10007916_28680 [Psychromonas marina]